MQTSRTTKSSPFPSPVPIIKKRRRILAPHASSQLGSDTFASTTNITETTKSTKKPESKIFEDQRTEDVISKAPVAVQTMLKVFQEIF
jgi:hypothetical protein